MSQLVPLPCLHVPGPVGYKNRFRSLLPILKNLLANPAWLSDALSSDTSPPAMSAPAPRCPATSPMVTSSRCPCLPVPGPRFHELVSLPRRHFLVAVDRFTKMAHFSTTQTTADAPDIALLSSRMYTDPTACPQRCEFIPCSTCLSWSPCSPTTSPAVRKIHHPRCRRRPRQV
jgi:hypothetical protein